MHYMARRFFQPVTVAAIPSQDGVRVDLTMVNDTAAPVEVALRTWLVTLSGERRPFRETTGVCSLDRAETLLSIAVHDLPQDELLFWSFEASNGMRGEGHHARATYKALDLKPSGAKLTATILREMERRQSRYGMVTMCVGGGQGAAGIFERMN